MSVQTIRVGLIGAGANTLLNHIPEFQAIEGVEIATVWNRSVESGRRVAEESGVPTVVTGAEAIFADDSIAAVCIGTWPNRHRKFSVRCVRRYAFGSSECCRPCGSIRSRSAEGGGRRVSSLSSNPS